MLANIKWKLQKAKIQPVGRPPSSSDPKLSWWVRVVSSIEWMSIQYRAQHNKVVNKRILYSSRLTTICYFLKTSNLSQMLMAIRMRLKLFLISFLTKTSKIEWGDLIYRFSCESNSSNNSYLSEECKFWIIKKFLNLERTTMLNMFPPSPRTPNIIIRTERNTENCKFNYVEWDVCPQQPTFS